MQFMIRQCQVDSQSQPFLTLPWLQQEGVDFSVESPLKKKKKSEYLEFSRLNPVGGLGSQT